MARHGENIRKRTDGRWEGRYKTFDENKNKYLYRSVYGRDYEEVRKKLFLLRLEAARCGAGQRTAAKAEPAGLKSEGGGRALLFSQAAEEWLAETACKRKHSTCVKYDTVYRTHLAERIGAYPLLAGTAEPMQKALAAYLSEKELSESLQKAVFCVANQILCFANGKYLAGLPLLERPPVRQRKKAVVPFSGAEQAMLLNRICGQADRALDASLLCLYTGLRLGEVCALQWTDIDSCGRVLTVSRTVQRIAVPNCATKTVLLETDPKSESSRRTIPLTPELLALLSRNRENRPYVFGGEKPLDPRTMQYRFQKLLREAGIENGTFHTLRHTFATNCMENGMDVKALSELLGHSDVKITLNRYVHPTMESKRKQLGALADFYGRIYGRAAGCGERQR